MAAKPEPNVSENNEFQSIVFTCKFCGETKPLEEMVTIRHFYPQLTACSECAKNKPALLNEEAAEPLEEAAQD